MLNIKYVKTTDAIKDIDTGSFVFCKEVKKGFIIKEAHKTITDDCIFGNVVNVIENMNYEMLTKLGIDSVEFKKGEIFVSEQVEEKVKLNLKQFTDLDHKNHFMDEFKIHKKYFDRNRFKLDDETNETQYADELSSQMIF